MTKRKGETQEEYNKRRVPWSAKYAKKPHVKAARKVRTNQWRLLHPENKAAWDKTYYQKNSERIKARSALRYAESPESIKLYQKHRYSENSEMIILYVTQWQREHPERRAVHARIRRTKKTLAGGKHTHEQWKELKATYEYTCLCCGRKEPEIELHADHIIPISKGGTSDIGNIQPLCKPCNSSKGIQIIDYRVSFERMIHHEQTASN